MKMIGKIARLQDLWNTWRIRLTKFLILAADNSRKGVGMWMRHLQFTKKWKSTHESCLLCGEEQYFFVQQAESKCTQFNWGLTCCLGWCESKDLRTKKFIQWQVFKLQWTFYTKTTHTLWNLKWMARPVLEKGHGILTPSYIMLQI